METGILDETNSWIQVVMQWKDLGDFSAVAEQSKYLQDLKCYLAKVATQLQMVNCDDVFSGRLLLLLSKLTEGGSVLLDRDITMSLVQCLLHFVSRVRNNEKSKSLAFYLLSKSMRGDVESFELGKLLNSIGATHVDFERTYVKELSDFIKGQAYVRLTKPSTGNPQVDALDTCEKSLHWDDSFIPLARLCLHLRHVDEFLSLLEAVLLYLIYCKRSDPQVEVLVKDVACQMSGENSNLFYGCLVILWTNYLSLLEEEVLKLIQTVTRTSVIESQSRLQQHSENLIKACQDHLDIHVAVDAMLNRIYIGSNKHAAVAWVYSSLSKAIWCEMSQLQTELHMTSFPLCYRSLVKLLMLDPFGMNTSTVVVRLKHLVTLIEDHLHSVDQDSSTVVEKIGWLLTQFPIWCWAALIICLHVDDQSMESAVWLIGWHSGMYFMTGATFSKLQEIASLLKAIIMRSPQNILGGDISTLRLLIDELSEFHAQSVVRKLLVVFCLQFRSSESTKREILCLLYGENHQLLCLQEMTDLLELSSDYPGSWIETFCCHMKEITNVAKLISDQITSPEESASTHWLRSRVTALSSP